MFDVPSLAKIFAVVRADLACSPLCNCKCNNTVCMWVLLICKLNA